MTFFWVVVLRFELSASHLLGMCSTTWNTPQAKTDLIVPALQNACNGVGDRYVKHWQIDRLQKSQSDEEVPDGKQQNSLQRFKVKGIE
jgi:hypothetical protein